MMDSIEELIRKRHLDSLLLYDKKDLQICPENMLHALFSSKVKKSKKKGVFSKLKVLEWLLSIQQHNWNITNIHISLLYDLDISYYNLICKKANIERVEISMVLYDRKFVCENGMCTKCLKELMVGCQFAMKLCKAQIVSILIEGNTLKLVKNIYCSCCSYESD